MSNTTKTIEIEMPPTGNHRLFEMGQVFPVAPGGTGNVTCPKCRTPLRAGVKKGRRSEYETWIQATSLQIKAAFGRLTPPVRVWVYIYGGKARKKYVHGRGKTLREVSVGFTEGQDLDNVQKCIGDAIKEAGVLIRREADGTERSDDSVRFIKAWRVEYFTRDEHLARLGDSRPKRADDLYAKCLIHIEPFL